MRDIKTLLMQIYRGEVEIESLSDDERVEVLSAMRDLSVYFMKNEKTAALGRKIATVLDGMTDDDEKEDPFIDAIVEAESRGSTYWELENDTKH